MSVVSHQSVFAGHNVINSQVKHIMRRSNFVFINLTSLLVVSNQLDQITDKLLEDEKRKLEKVSGFQVLEYVRTSIEIIMNLKIEDLEKEFNNRNLFEKDS